MLQENEDRSNSQLTLPWRGEKKWAVGEYAILINRRGDQLGSGRISAIMVSPNPSVQLVQVDVPTHLVWDARGLRRGKSTQMAAAEEYAASLNVSPVEKKIEMTLDGDRRLIRDQIPLSIAFFEMGNSRSEDKLLCPDGSCGLCQVSVDGVNKLACQSQTHRGMAVKLKAPQQLQLLEKSDVLCPCLSVDRAQVVERLRQGRLKSPEAVISVTHVGSGRCHGQICIDALRRLMIEEGIDASQWIDWRFPWSDWVLTPGAHDRG